VDAAAETCYCRLVSPFPRRKRPMHRYTLPVAADMAEGLYTSALANP